MDPLAVLISGGLDSAILLGQALQQQSVVFPLYVRCGLLWESVELAHLRKYLEALRAGSLQALTILEQPVVDLYGSHWSITGQGVPAGDTPDAAVFLPGRNVLVLSKAILWCHLHRVPALALGTLASNPFPDATPQFFQDMQRVVNESVQGRVAIRLPLAGLKKAEVMRLGRGLPLQLSFSCINPKDGWHCGQCNKCAERKQAFADVGMADPTDYAQE
jgi:7-cyano-7-deazaguanine synthase